MKTQYYTATSLDGFIADEQHSLDWLFQLGIEPGEAFGRFMADVGAVAMGSATYEWLLKNHIYADPDQPKPWVHAQPTWVFTSRTLREVPGADVRFVRGDVRPVHAEMVAAAKGKNVWLVGGGELVGQFHDHGLLDELHIGIASVTLGGGAPLLPRRIVSPPLRIVAVQQLGTGMLQVTYAVGKPTGG